MENWETRILGKRNDVWLKRVGFPCPEYTAAYVRYLHSLRPFNPELAGKTEEALRLIAEQETQESSDRTVYWIKKNDERVGFVVLGKYPNAFCRNDMFVQEFFIEEEARGQGYGTLAVRRLLQISDGRDFSLFVLKLNTAAERFWRTAFARYGLTERTEAGGIRAESPVSRWMYFSI